MNKICETPDSGANVVQLPRRDDTGPTTTVTEYTAADLTELAEVARGDDDVDPIFRNMGAKLTASLLRVIR